MVHNAYGATLTLMNLLLAGGVLAATTVSAQDTCKGEALHVLQG